MKDKVDIIDITPQAKYQQMDFNKFLIDLSKDIKEPQPLISIAGKPLFTRGNLSSISGKTKSRKTFLIGLLASQYFDAEDKAMVMIFDTEQAAFHAQKSAKRIHRLQQWDESNNDERLKIFTLREQSTEERLKFVTAAIYHFKPDLVFIDGIRDLLYDFNSISESSDIVNLLMKLSSETNCHICSVLHENKADNNLRGHIGTELQNKSETVISVEIDGNTSAVSPKHCRNVPFEKFWFRVDNEGLPEHCDPELKPKNNEKLKSLFNGILPVTCCLSFADLRTKVMDKTGIAIRTAERRIKEALEDNIIAKNHAGMYYSYENNNLDSDEDDRLPF